MDNKERMKILIIILFLTFNLYSQESKISIKAGGEKIVYNLKKCLKRGKLIKTKKGVQFKIVVWGGYAPWSKGYSLIVRSIGGTYSLNMHLDDLVKNIEINFDK